MWICGNFRAVQLPHTTNCVCVFTRCTECIAYTCQLRHTCSVLVQMQNFSSVIPKRQIEKEWTGRGEIKSRRANQSDRHTHFPVSRWKSHSKTTSHNFYAAMYKCCYIHFYFFFSFSFSLLVVFCFAFFFSRSLQSSLVENFILLFDLKLRCVFENVFHLYTSLELC